jgi:ERCC4-type nuclease
MTITAAFIDSREPQNMQGLKFGGVPVAITTLECGDAWISTDDNALLCIERKTPSDLLGSIKDGRLFLQCAAMRAKTPWAYLLISGALQHTLDGHVITDNRTTGWKFDAVQGALLDVQEMGVNVVVCQSDQHYEEAIIRLARRDRKAAKAIEPRTQARVLTQQEQVLISLPGIGVERAGWLLAEHGSAAYSIAWLTWLDSISEMEGIGNGTKHGVRRALGLAAEEWLSVMTTEKSDYAAREVFQEVSTPILGV